MGLHQLFRFGVVALYHNMPQEAGSGKSSGFWDNGLTAEAHPKQIKVTLRLWADRGDFQCTLRVVLGCRQGHVLIGSGLYLSRPAFLELFLINSFIVGDWKAAVSEPSKPSPGGERDPLTNHNHGRAEQRAAQTKRRPARKDWRVLSQ